MMTSQQPLDGIRVLDFTRVLAGPFASMMLADLGADVIKVEHPQAGDDTRQWGPPWAHGQSAYFASLNRNKRSLTLNLKTDEGQQLARRLAARSHIVLENMKVGGMARFRLGYEDLRQLNPALVYASITGFGQGGPYAQRPGYDFVIQAMSGLMSITGEPDAPPQKVGVAITDVLTGLYTLSGVLAALRSAEATGQGQYLDIALLDCSLASLVNIAGNYFASGQAPVRFGNQHPNIVPYQVFQAQDRGFVVAVGNDRQFTALCELLGEPGWAQDPRFATNPARVEHRAVLVPLLAAAFTTRPAADWVAALLAAGVPAGPINDLPTIMQDPQVAARAMVQTLPNGTQVPGNPLADTTTASAPPGLGEHTESVLRGVVGLSNEQIAAYRARGVV